MSEAWPKAKWTGDEFTWFVDVADTSGEAPIFGLIRVQADVLRETGAYLRLLRVNPDSGGSIHLGAGSAILVRGRGDTFGGDAVDPEPWPVPAAHVAVVTPIHAIAIVVDRSLGANQGVLMGDGKHQRVVFSS